MSKDEIVWRKSSLSSDGGGQDCVEVAFLPGNTVGVRDSKHNDNDTAPVLEFTHSEWEAFLGGIRNGEFDL